MKLEEFCPKVFVCPQCSTIVKDSTKVEGIFKGDTITLLPCKHVFMDTSQGIRQLQ